MKKMTLLLFGLVFWASSAVHGQILEVTQVYQEQSLWCWAATSVSVLDYYGFHVSQGEVAQYGTEGKNIWNWLYGSSVEPTRNGVDLILDHFANLSSRGFSMSFTLTMLENEMENNRPIIIRWGWDSGDGHILLIHGVAGDMVHLMDPYYGPTINDFSWLKRGSGHTWTHSLLMDSAPETAVDIPSEHLKFQLFQNSPNPFNPETQIRFSLSEASDVVLTLYNVQGQKVKSLMNERLTPGAYSVRLNAQDLSTGVYFYRLRAGARSLVRRCFVVK